MSKTLLDLCIDEIKKYHSTTTVSTFFLDKLTQINNKYQFKPNTTEYNQTISGCINLFYSMHQSDLIVSLTFYSLINVLLDYKDSLVFNDALFYLNMPSGRDNFLERNIFYSYLYIPMKLEGKECRESNEILDKISRIKDDEDLVEKLYLLLNESRLS